MWNLLWPVLTVIAANTIYHICAKSTPESLNLFASLALSYFVAMLCAIAMFFLTSREKNFLTELSKANWTTFALGIAIVGLEFGFLCVYRAGWNVSIANLVTSVLLSCVLLAVGLLLYRESLSLRQVAGMAVCMTGLLLILK